MLFEQNYFFEIKFLLFARVVLFTLDFLIFATKGSTPVMADGCREGRNIE